MCTGSHRPCLHVFRRGFSSFDGHVRPSEPNAFDPLITTECIDFFTCVRRLLFLQIPARALIVAFVRASKPFHPRREVAVSSCCAFSLTGRSPRQMERCLRAPVLGIQDGDACGGVLWHRALVDTAAFPTRWLPPLTWQSSFALRAFRRDRMASHVCGTRRLWRQSPVSLTHIS